MSRIDDILGDAAQAVDTAVRRMPEREARTVETRSARKSAMTGIGAALVVVVVGVVGWLLLSGGGGDVAPIDDPEGSPNPVFAEVDADGWELFFTGRAGTYRTDRLSVPISFTLAGTDGEAPWTKWSVSPWEVGLNHPERVADGDRDLKFIVVERLSDPGSLRGSSWPVDDIYGWLDAAGPDVVVAGPTDVVVAGREAIRFTVRPVVGCDDVGPGDFEEAPCDTLGYSAEGTGGQLFMPNTAAEWHVWWVPDVGGGAFVAFAGVFPSNAERWIPTVEGVVDSLGIGTAPVNPDPAPEAVGDRELLVETARAAAAEVGDPELEAAVEEAVESGLLDYSGPPEEAIVNILEFLWLVDVTNPEPEMLDAIVAPEATGRSAFENADTFGGDGLLVVTGQGDYTATNPAVIDVADFSPAIAAVSPDDAVAVQVDVFIPEIDVLASNGSKLRTVAERDTSLVYLLVPTELGWLIWSELG